MVKTKDFQGLRNSKGQFVVTTGSTEYKKVQYKGQSMGEHQKVWILCNGVIPKGKIIHHINGHKKDNRIENLKCMSLDEHNKFHLKGSIPWNKGKKCLNISESKKGHEVSESQIKKVKETWKKKYLPSMKEIYTLRQNGIGYKQISSELNLSQDTIAHRLMTYKHKYLKEVIKNE